MGATGFPVKRNREAKEVTEQPTQPGTGPNQSAGETPPKAEADEAPP